MTRPCTCDMFVGPAKQWGRGNCRLCWLFHHDPRYWALWHERSGVCAHRGPEISRELCPTCSGHVEVKVFACTKHARCTIAKPIPDAACCQTCPDYADLPPDSRLS